MGARKPLKIQYPSHAPVVVLGFAEMDEKAIATKEVAIMFIEKYKSEW